jgi:hypothetical protein
MTLHLAVGRRVVGSLGLLRDLAPADLADRAEAVGLVVVAEAAVRGALEAPVDRAVVVGQVVVVLRRRLCSVLIRTSQST